MKAGYEVIGSEEIFQCGWKAENLEDEDAFHTELFIYTPFFSHQMELKERRKPLHITEILTWCQVWATLDLDVVFFSSYKNYIAIVKVLRVQVVTWGLTWS